VHTILKHYKLRKKVQTSSFMRFYQSCIELKLIPLMLSKYQADATTLQEQVSKAILNALSASERAAITNRWVTSTSEFQSAALFIWGVNI
jgi:hypothetical protein